MRLLRVMYLYSMDLWTYGPRKRRVSQPFCFSDLPFNRAPAPLCGHGLLCLGVNVRKATEQGAL